MKDVSARIVAENGKPVFLNETSKKKFYDHLIKNEGKELNLTISGESKTNQQLAYLFGVVFPIISEYTGFTVEEVYQEYKRKYLSYEKEVKGKIYKFTKGLSNCSLNEAKDFIDKCIIHATSDLGLNIPEPEEVR